MPRGEERNMIWDELKDFGWIGMIVGISLVVQHPRYPYALWLMGIAFTIHSISDAIPRSGPDPIPLRRWQSVAGATYTGLAVMVSAAMFWMLFHPSILSIGTLLAVTVIQIVYRRARWAP
jgi:hypothetical protein